MDINKKTQLPDDTKKLIFTIKEQFEKQVNNIDHFQIRSSLKHFFNNNLENLITASKLTPKIQTLYKYLAQNLQIQNISFDITDNDCHTIANDIIKFTDQIDLDKNIDKQTQFLNNAYQNISKFVETHYNTTDITWDDISKITPTDMNNILSQKNIFIHYEFMKNMENTKISTNYHNCVEHYAHYLIAFAIAKS
jgi:hypothetical protein